MAPCTAARWPPRTADGEFDGTLWFFTRASAPKVDEVDRDHKVNVSYSKPGGQSFVSVRARRSWCVTQAKNKELWTPAMKAWFPKGPEDPETALLKIDVEKAEYWDTAAGPIVIAIGFVKAMVTGKPYHPGENEKISFERAGLRQAASTVEQGRNGGTILRGGGQVSCRDMPLEESVTD